MKRLFLIIALGIAAIACTPGGGSSAAPGSSAATPSEAAPSESCAVDRGLPGGVRFGVLVRKVRHAVVMSWLGCVIPAPDGAAQGTRNSPRASGAIPSKQV